MATTIDRSGRHGFDFLHGTWRVDNRRLVGRLTGSEEWDEFVARQTCRPILGGIGNIDDFRPESGEWLGYEGAAIRIFNSDRDESSIYWADNVQSALQPPVMGRFIDGIGEFHGEDVLNGQPVLVRFRWSAITAESAHWEQAFSGDGGTAWETNWHMHFTRIA